MIRHTSRSLLLCTAVLAALAGPPAGQAFAGIKTQISIAGGNTVNERDAGTKKLEYTISIGSRNSGVIYSVDWETVEEGMWKGTADANLDYTPVGGTVTWNGGSSSSQTISVPILDDAVVDGKTENIYVELKNPKKSEADTFFDFPTVGTPTFGWIEDNDPVATTNPGGGT